MVGAPRFDVELMRAALSLARRNLGNCWPNPAVGCVLVREDTEGEPIIVGRGWTERGGRPHAETQALMRAGEQASGATAYVTLEPCAHQGQTGPCAEALIGAGIKRVVIAAQDPDPRVSGRGIEMLKVAGIAVDVGVLRAEAEHLNCGHIKRITKNLPMVTLKLATTLDGRIALHTGESHWITGERARAEAQRLRAEHDAVLIGSETAVQDDPRLTCRLPGMESRSPVRVIADGRLRLSLTGVIASSATEVPTWILTRPDAPAARRKAFSECGIDIIDVEPVEGGTLDLRLALELMAARGITRVLAEGGARLAAALILAGLVDEIAWFRAPAIIGGDGRAAVEGFDITRMAEIRRFHRIGVRPIGADLLETYVRAA